MKKSVLVALVMTGLIGTVYGSVPSVVATGSVQGTTQLGTFIMYSNFTCKYMRPGGETTWHDWSLVAGENGGWKFWPIGRARSWPASVPT